uniref:Uncharacterized protein n=1 Tax=Strongyloides stercoralis TaxID=6248 RepID=A0A0K0EJ02_STRER
MSIKPELTKIQQNFLKKSKKKIENEVCFNNSQTILPYTISKCDVDSESSIVKKVKLYDIEKSWDDKIKYIKKYQISKRNKYFLLNFDILERISSFNLVFGIVIFIISIGIFFFSQIEIFMNIFILGIILSFIGLISLMMLMKDYTYLSIMFFGGSIVFIDGIGIILSFISLIVYDNNISIEYLIVNILWLCVFLFLLVEMLYVIYLTIRKISVNHFNQAIKWEDNELIYKEEKNNRKHNEV